MEMPEDCFECPFGIIDDTEDGVWCNALAQQSSGQREDCPIICQLPEGHGRLVDAAVLKNKNIRKPRGVSSYDYGAMATVFMDIINDTPTIVPAERRET
jgi:hypothetical protein